VTQHLPHTVTVPILVTKSLEIKEPDWCAGHPNDRAQYKADITHFGPEHVVEINGFDLFRAMLAQHPFADRATPTVQLYIEQQDITGSYSPAEVEQLADALVDAAGRLRALGRDLARILAGGGQ
jgi:hypothetical protein